jgi:GNAT superfamily N-acetyltransferase
MLRMPHAPFCQVRRATLADVAAVARLSVPANQEAVRDLPALADGEELSAPELALRLLDDLDDGCLLYVAEREVRIIGFGLVTGLMVGDGGHLVELRRVYVTPEARQRGAGRLLLDLVLRELEKRPNPPGMRAWAADGSEAGRFLEAVGGTAMRQRWKVGPGGIAVRGVVYDWAGRQVPSAQDRAVAK